MTVASSSGTQRAGGPMEVIGIRGSHRHPDCSIEVLGRASFMEVVAVAERERQWRWEIRHGGQLVR